MFTQNELDMIWDALYGRKVQKSRAGEEEEIVSKYNNLLDKVSSIKEKNKAHSKSAAKRLALVNGDKLDNYTQYLKS